MVAAFGKNQVGTHAAGRLTTTLPWLSAGFDPAPGQRCGWGLGTAVHLQPGPQGRHAGSLAWAGITNTHFWLDPQARLGAVLMLQLLPFADPAALAVLAAFERAVYSQS
jgi:CubicO group peptidase (beta-lactamase class C family)